MYGGTLLINDLFVSLTLTFPKGDTCMFIEGKASSEDMSVSHLVRYDRSDVLWYDSIVSFKANIIFHVPLDTVFMILLVWLQGKLNIKLY